MNTTIIQMNARNSLVSALGNSVKFKTNKNGESEKKQSYGLEREENIMSNLHVIIKKKLQ